MELISVIVPVYNVEIYLEKCVKSILEQSYQNLEIILVDDGSTDKSGELCEKFKYDERVVVLHKENGGLSSARNHGIKHAHGEYLYFIDSDDYIDKNFINNLLNALKKNNCDISMCGYTREENSFSDIKDESVVSSDKVLKNILLQNNQELYSVAAWNKLYRRELFSDIEYPLGKLNEDMFVICEILMKTDKVAVIDYAGYFYRVNAASITQKSFQHKNMDVIEACDHIIEFLNTYHPDNTELHKAAVNLKFRRSFQMLYKLWISQVESNEDEKILYDYIISVKKAILFDSSSKKSSKILAAALYVFKKSVLKKIVGFLYKKGRN